MSGSAQALSARCAWMQLRQLSGHLIPKPEALRDLRTRPLCCADKTSGLPVPPPAGDGCCSLAGGKPESAENVCFAKRNNVTWLQLATGFFFPPNLCISSVFFFSLPKGIQRALHILKQVEMEQLVTWRRN